MKVGIIGGGFTGLAAGFKLAKEGHKVWVIEKDGHLGGLATGFSNPKWDWTLEKAYHHWFTNDDIILNLAREINHRVIIKRPLTDVFIKGKKLPFDSALSLLIFPYLPIIDRLRVGSVLLYLKLSNHYKIFENQKALPWIKKWMGIKATELIWEPLFEGKFGQFKNEVSLTWFWARIKKRTSWLAYPEGGFKSFADHLGKVLKDKGVKILLETSVKSISSNKNFCIIETENKKFRFDKIIGTLPSPIFAKVADGLPQEYIKRITSIPHLHALILILVLKKPFMDKTYWLNITDKSYPFLVLAEHTNFMDLKYYGGEHILYVGNYLSPGHLYLKMSKEQLLKKFDPFLREINPNYKLSLINYHLFTGPFAQPIVTINYPKLIPSFQTPLKNIYIANLDMVYPWDRGTNYAIELGQKVADIVTKIS